jgi:hypothetical protein
VLIYHHHKLLVLLKDNVQYMLKHNTMKRYRSMHSGTPCFLQQRQTCLIHLLMRQDSNCSLVTDNMSSTTASSRTVPRLPLQVHAIDKYCHCNYAPFTKGKKNPYLESSVFCDTLPCYPLKVNRHFGGTCHLDLTPCYLFLAGFLPWRWRQNASLKHQLTFNRLYSIISQKIELFITTAVRSLKSYNLCGNHVCLSVCDLVSVPILCDRFSSNLIWGEFH